MDNELSNILENTPPKQKQNDINISQISKDTLKNIINDNNREDISLYEVDDVSVKRGNTLNKFLLKSREKEDNEERLKDKEDRKKLREEAKEEEKKKREEDKKKRDEEKKKKEEEKKIKEEEKKKEKEEKKKEKEEKRLKEKGIKDADEIVSGSNGFFHKFLHKNTVMNRIRSVDNLSKSSSNSPIEFRENLKRKISKSQPLLFDSKKKKNESPNGSTEHFSNVSSLINLLENNKFGSNNNNETKSNDSISGPHNEPLYKNRVKKNVNRFNQNKFNFNIEISNNDNTFSPHENNTEQVKSSTSPGKAQNNIDNIPITTIKDQSSSSNNGLLISKKVAAPPKRRPPTKEKLMQNAETAFTQRTGNDPNIIINTEETSINNFKDITSNKLPSSPLLLKNNNLLEINNKEVNENCRNQSESDDDDKNLFNDSLSSSNAIDLKKRMTQRLLSKQKFSDKLYPGGENCDSDIVEIKSISNTSEYDSHGIISEKEDNVNVFNSSRENIITKKNATFNGPVPPFRKERSTNLNLNGGCKTPKSPSSGNIYVITSNITSNIPTKKKNIEENHSKLLISPRVNAKIKRRPPSHIGIANNTKETIFTLKEDDEKDFLSPSKQESYMSNIKISEVKIAKKIDQKQINVLKLPNKGPTMINNSNIEDNSDAKNKLPSNSVMKKIKNLDSNNSLQNNNEDDNEEKEGKKSSYNNNKSSLIHPSLMNELDGQLNKRASLRANTNINIEEKMHKMSKMKQEKQEDTYNKDIYNIKLKSKGSKYENNNKLSKENSGSNSELANNAFFKRRANIVNSENDNKNENEHPNNEENENEKRNNNEFDFSVIKLKNVKKVDVNQMKRKENNDNEENFAIETPTLVKPSNFNKNHINKLGDNNPSISPLKSSPNTPSKSKFLP